MVCACIFVDGLITRRIIRWGMHVTVYHDRTITTDSIVLYDVSSISTFNIIHIIFLFFLHWVFGVYIVPSTTKFSPFFSCNILSQAFYIILKFFSNLIFSRSTIRFLSFCHTKCKINLHLNAKPYFHSAFKLMIDFRR